MIYNRSEGQSADEWAAACRLTFLMRWLKTSEDEAGELDPVG